MQNNLYVLDISEKKVDCHDVNAATNEHLEDLWHQRYEHLSVKNLRLLRDQKLVTGLDFQSTKESDFCEGCAQGKQKRAPFPKEQATRASEILGIIHSDVCGPMQENSLGGNKYFVTFIDDKSRFTAVYFMKTKDQLLDKFKEYEAMVTNITGKKIMILRSDNGGEYTSKEFVNYLKEKGIQHQLSVPRTPQQNGVAERMNRTIQETARSMIHNAGLDTKFWAEAVCTAVTVRHRCPTVAVNNMTLYECFNDEFIQQTKFMQIVNLNDSLPEDQEEPQENKPSSEHVISGDQDTVDHDEAKYTSIRSLLAIANQLDLEVHQMDVSTAFLNGELEEEIYMKQPEGYVKEAMYNQTRTLNEIETRNKKRMRLHQSQYLTNLLKKFGMEKCKPAATPVDQGTKLLPNDGEPVEKTKYQALIGGLTYAVTGVEHWTAAKRILRYIKGTLDYGITFDGNKETEVQLSGYVDADWGSNPNGRKSQSGYLFTLCGGVISWAMGWLDEQFKQSIYVMLGLLKGGDQVQEVWDPT
ncbi:Retrovirus-related Pol poly from transposon TNT 1-94 [Paramuricea clavata]|uniref:Retrovirus-related Pol poly from transposon TNT 1-94 n=1 Tax=Paramuricea clavata TaxID=317549 RepID=A0A6S7GWI1_PARCT|nr:Retrovirus-related Pol poly from transposon TNT 1-94 [Paramuricea clavata]